jgi:hypothetical protein
VGIYLGTSVNNFGSFTVGPTYEFYPGMQFLTAATLHSKQTLLPGVVACSGLGTSPSYPNPPNSTQYDITTTYTAATSSAPSNTTVSETKNSTKTSVQSGCLNGDRATLISGTSIPTQSGYVPALSIGIIFNSNLMKAFSSIFK